MARVHQRQPPPAAVAQGARGRVVGDLEVLVGGDSVSVRSSSRIGDSDLGVNAKRLAYLAKDLKAKGWDVVTPPVK